MPAATAERAPDPIQREIDNHGKTWCSPGCQTFLPIVYRKRRQQGQPSSAIQGDYDSCHIFR